ncbi:ATP-binding cassette domain-containing protein [Ancylomarina euxinus]|uniref:ATP-binding cassette domain-containing protein n=1 Tax=Ancylomarina euxinus TaxID=2283627 RepID=A0A425XXD9_9BACT|nr:ATP-binding cassette domain-containing protein [Ancylomarina euxinus]MCZ4696116.1 ATP-binding cassette domain-containing protein [Ancylomarina euxinus]MUP16525.1 ATP-binding cassette domain-containing protein [Ancylomarina euxinus]RRG19327.1 ATP-binding cassette domain-containing protein [Ancylomarina euxinus]
MNESVLNALMKLFAIIVDEQKHGFELAARDVVANYLETRFNKEWQERYLSDFDTFLKASYYDNGNLDYIQTKHKQLTEVCVSLLEEVDQEQKVWIMLQLLEFIDDSEFVGDEILKFVQTVSSTFKISDEEFEYAQQFILGDEYSIPFNEHLLLIDSNEDFKDELVKHIYVPKLRGRVFVLRIKSTNTYLIKYFGEYNLFLNGHNIKIDRSYLITFGSVIRSSRIDPIYYSQIVAEFIVLKNRSQINLVAKDIEFKFKGTENGIHSFSFKAESGQLIGIMGGSGTGKSTLLNVLNGNLPLNSGNIWINGYDIHKQKDKLAGVIGYVPQDDLLLEELTVFENLYYNSKLCFDKFSEDDILNIIEDTLEKFDLIEARDLKVGDPINKILSGGQRKRLNIALEMMRRPSILFVDEPTSGLSSMDSEKVMLLLKRQTLRGRLVMCNIHQPSSDIFKLLDVLIIMDQGGRVIYSGNPVEAIVYFKTQSHFVNADESECLTCGNVSSEQILKIVETKMTNEYGKQIRKRKRGSEEWYAYYKEKIESKKAIQTPKKKTVLPDNYFQIPQRYQQLKIYLSRDINSKLSNIQYMMITLFEAPLLAVILGYFTKYIIGTIDDPSTYIFAENENLPSYIFMAVVVALFLGLIISAEEILHDRRIIKRESFLNLSRLSYINSKVLVMLGISAIQSFFFVIIANSILEIKGLNFEYWLMLYTVSACANLIGLNLSASLNSVVAVYVSIPFILVPQLLFSGVIVSYNKLHPSITTQKYVPVCGDLMTSRWAYEALMVEQFSKNEFEKQFFDLEKEMSDASYKASFLIPELSRRFKAYVRLTHKNQNGEKKLKLIRSEFAKLSDIDAIPKDISVSNADSVNQWLDDLQQVFRGRYSRASTKRDKAYHDLLKEYGGSDELFAFKQRYHNKAIEKVVLNKRELTKFTEYKGELVRLKDPIFKSPEHKVGRAHFYAAEKRLGNYLIETFWFNLGFIWLTTAFFYLTLYFDFFRRFFVHAERLWLKLMPHGDFIMRLKRL